MAYKNRLSRTVKAKWVAALRSGKYKQTRGLLYREEGDPNNTPGRPAGYCCLGVLARVQGKPNRTLAHRGGLTFKDSKDNPVPAGYAWFGAESDTIINRLIRMNDKEKKSFKQIAAWIVKNL